MVIEVSFGGKGFVFLRKHAVYQLLAGCFTIGARNADERNIQLSS